MKQILIAVSVIIALGVVAQRGKITTEVPTEDVKVVNPNNPKPGKNLEKGEIKMTDGVTSAKPESKPKSGATVKDLGDEMISGREVGMQRAEEARAKHTEPKTEAEAAAMVTSINESTKSTVDGTATKIADARQMLDAKKNSGSISELEYDLKSSILDDYEARRKAIADKL